MGVHEISTAEIREQQAEIFNRIAYRGNHYVVTRRGKELVALLSAEEYHELMALREALEESLDLADAKQALKEYGKGGKRLKRLADELGLDV